MGLFDRGDKEELFHKIGQLEAKVELLQLHNEELKREKETLNGRIRDLQDVVVAIKAPESYRALMDDRLVKEWDGKGYKPGENDEMKAYQMMTQMMEGPYIRSADDLFNLLPKQIPIPAPLHEGNEGS